jgi:hypothetical protein
MSEHIRFDLSFPPGQHAALVRALKTDQHGVIDKLVQFDARTADATVPRDKEMIFELIKTTFANVELAAAEDTPRSQPPGSASSSLWSTRRVQTVGIEPGKKSKQRAGEHAVDVSVRTSDGSPLNTDPMDIFNEKLHSMLHRSIAAFSWNV